ncbi:hypothetical protein LTS10_006142 [Elasticomyces elasticus]|nr:hypothetical protein LTS10_006142 [Elasticomyces elasticus]
MSFIDLEAPVSVDNQAGYVNEMQVETTPAATQLERKDVPTASVAKRKATSTMEPQHNKKPRASSQISEGVDEVERGKSSSPEVVEISKETSVEASSGEDTGHAGKSKEEVRMLKEKLQEAEEQVDIWRRENCSLEAELDDLESRKQTRVSGSTVNKKIEGSIKKECKQKIEKLEAKHKLHLEKTHAVCQERIDDLKLKQVATLKDKDASTEKKMQEYRATCKKLVNTARGKEKEAKDELSEAKKEMVEHKKGLKADQQAAINKYKPGFSPMLKEKDQAIKALTAEKTALEEELKKHKQNVNLCEQEINRLTSVKEALELIIEQYITEKDTLSKEVSLQARNIEIILRRETEGEERAEARFEEEMVAWEDRLKHEGQRWAQQSNNAKDSAVRLVEQQRANHSLKGMVTSRDNSIRTLNAKVRELEAAIMELRAVIEGHEIGIATLKTEDSKSATVATVEEDVIASAETSDIKMKQELESVDTTSPEGSGGISISHGATKSVFGGGVERYAVDEGDDDFAEKAAIDGTNAKPGMLEQATATFTGLGEVEMVAEPSQEEAMA